MTIPIDFKKFLPYNLRSTRWGEMIEAYQSIMGELDTDLIEKMMNQYDLDNATSTDYQYILSGFGWQYSSYTGWAEETEYFKRQALTCVDRILYKTTRRAYLDEFYIFNLTGDVYPLKEELDGTLAPFTSWWDHSEVEVELVQILDSELPNILYIIPFKFDRGTTLDDGSCFDDSTTYYDDPIYLGSDATYLDMDSSMAGFLEILDGYTELETLTRFVLIQFKFNKVEDASYFLSTNSMRAFYNDVKIIKRITESVYFEPILELPYNTAGTVRSTSYDNFVSGETGGTMQTIMIADSFSDLTTIIVGTGAHSTVDATITNVQTPVYTISSDSIIADDDNPLTEFRKALSVKNKFYNFSEVAFFDSGGTCFFYATFPEVQYYKGERCYSNIKFKFIPYT